MVFWFFLVPTRMEKRILKLFHLTHHLNLFMSLLISKLFCTMGEGGRALQPSPLPPLRERSEFTMSRWGREGWPAGQSELTMSRSPPLSPPHKPYLCNGGQHFVPYRWLLISNKLCDLTLCTCGGLGGGGRRNRCIMLIMTMLKLFPTFKYSISEQAPVHCAAKKNSTAVHTCFPPSKSLRSAPYKQQVH